MTILAHPLWPQLAQYFVAVRASRGDSAKQRVRIEVNAMPQGLYAVAIRATMPCVSCGRDIHPIRARKAPSKREDATSGAYYAAACPIAESVGCSRGAAASAEYSRIRQYLGDVVVAPRRRTVTALEAELKAALDEVAALRRRLGSGLYQCQLQLSPIAAELLSGP